MKIKINAELTGQEILDLFINQLKENKIDPDLTKIKIFVTNKNGQEVVLDADKIKVTYSNE